MSKRFRQGQILQLIRNIPVFTQEEIAEELAKRGIQTTQVTLSRDLRELGLVKTQDGYREMAQTNASDDLGDLFREFVADIRIAKNLLVVKMDPGHASLVAVALDRQEWSEVIGTIAGDDTVLIVTADDEAAQSLRGKLLGFLR